MDGTSLAGPWLVDAVSQDSDESLTGSEVVDGGDDNTVRSWAGIDEAVVLGHIREDALAWSSVVDEARQSLHEEREERVGEWNRRGKVDLGSGEYSSWLRVKSAVELVQRSGNSTKHSPLVRPCRLGPKRACRSALQSTRPAALGWPTLSPGRAQEPRQEAGGDDHQQLEMHLEGARGQGASLAV